MGDIILWSSNVSFNWNFVEFLIEVEKAIDRKSPKILKFKDKLQIALNLTERPERVRLIVKKNILISNWRCKSIKVVDNQIAKKIKNLNRNAIQETFEIVGIRNKETSRAFEGQRSLIRIAWASKIDERDNSQWRFETSKKQKLNARDPFKIAIRKNKKYS
jgi:hypothetical protein